METPFGPFEPSVELDESQTHSIQKSLEFLEHVRTGNEGSFSVEVHEGQPFIVKTINGKRLELPVFEAAELDAQRLYGYPPIKQIPLRIDGKHSKAIIAKDDAPPMVDALVGIMLVVINGSSYFPEWLRNALR